MCTGAVESKGYFARFYKSIHSILLLILCDATNCFSYAKLLVVKLKLEEFEVGIVSPSRKCYQIFRRYFFRSTEN